MNNTYCSEFQEIVERFEGWWSRDDIGRPLMRIIACGRRGNIKPISTLKDISDTYLNSSYLVDKYRNYCETHYFLADAYPNLSADLGAGSLALYLGGEPKFSEDTIWFVPAFDQAKDFYQMSFSPESKWWQKHIKLIQDVKKLARGDFIVNVPDLIENLDILSALLDPLELCLALIDEPEAVKHGVDIVNDAYFECYDYLQKIVEEDHITSFTAFTVLGKGRVAKVQCDFSALISIDMFREFVLDSLRHQCRNLDHSVYHLDGPDAIKHLPALMEIEELDALQWTCGAGQPDGTSVKWYPIYDIVRAAGKSLWIMIEDGTPEDWAKGTLALTERYGKRGMYFLYPDFPDLRTAESFIEAFSL